MISYTTFKTNLLTITLIYWDTYTFKYKYNKTILLVKVRALFLITYPAKE